MNVDERLLLLIIFTQVENNKWKHLEILYWILCQTQTVCQLDRVHFFHQFVLRYWKDSKPSWKIWSNRLSRNILAHSEPTCFYFLCSAIYIELWVVSSSVSLFSTHNVFCPFPLVLLWWNKKHKQFVRLMNKEIARRW